MKLILLSLGLGCLIDHLVKKSSILFIPNAGDPYENPDFVRDDYNRLMKLGYNVTELDLKKEVKSYEQLINDKIDAIFIAGGNTFYLLSLVQKTGFDETLIRWVKSNKLYIGASAGAIIMGPSIEPIITIDDPNEAPELKSYNSLHVIDVVLLPHYGKEKYLPKYYSIIDKYGSIYTLQTLKDDEAMLFTSPTNYSKIKSELVLHD